MKRQSVLVLALVILFVVTSPTTVEAVPDWLNPDWDILEETYGNGAGQVSFNASYDLHSGLFEEVLHDGYVTLTSGPDVTYAGKTTIPSWPTNDSDLTIEYKVRDVSNNGLAAYFSQTNDIETTLWQHIPYLNFSAPDTLVDYYGDNGLNLAPDGFDGSAVHTYRFVRQEAKSFLYLLDDDTPYFLCELQNSLGWSLTYIEFGTPSGSYHEIEFYHLKVANGAHIPEPSTLLLLSLGAVMLRRKR